MTAMMRQIRKQTLTMMIGLQVFAAAGILCASPTLAGDTATSFVTDPLTGVALDGYDPVSYFTEPAPLPGVPDFEYDWQGVPWYFANAANRDVFIRTPEIYAPQFGGHATTGLAGGYLSDGNPQIFMIVAKRLYLFYSTANRDAFLTAPGKIIASARQHWAAMNPGQSAQATPPGTATPAASTPPPGP
jgi:YHS domain-containing protein